MPSIQVSLLLSSVRLCLLLCLCLCSSVFCVREVCEALHQDTHHVVVYRAPAFVERGRAPRARFGPVVDVLLNEERLRYVAVGVRDAPSGHHPRATHMAPASCGWDSPYEHH